jgi:hypothetical protein
MFKYVSQRGRRTESPVPICEAQAFAKHTQVAVGCHDLISLDDRG